MNLHVNPFLALSNKFRHDFLILFLTSRNLAISICIYFVQIAVCSCLLDRLILFLILLLMFSLITFISFIHGHFPKWFYQFIIPTDL